MLSERLTQLDCQLQWKHPKTKKHHNNSNGLIRDKWQRSQTTSQSQLGDKVVDNTYSLVVDGAYSLLILTRLIGSRPLNYNMDLRFQVWLIVNKNVWMTNSPAVNLTIDNKLRVRALHYSINIILLFFNLTLIVGLLILRIIFNFPKWH